MKAQRDDAPRHNGQRKRNPLIPLVGLTVVVLLGALLFGQQLLAVASHPGQWLASIRINGHPLNGNAPEQPAAQPSTTVPAPPDALPAERSTAAAHREFQQETVKSIQTTAPSR